MWDVSKNAHRPPNAQLGDLLKDAERHSSSLKAGYCSAASPTLQHIFQLLHSEPVLWETNVPSNCPFIYCFISPVCVHMCMYRRSADFTKPAAFDGPTMTWRLKAVIAEQRSHCLLSTFRPDVHGLENDHLIEKMCRRGGVKRQPLRHTKYSQIATVLLNITLPAITSSSVQRFPAYVLQAAV